MTVKLAINTLFGVQLAALAEIIGLFGKSGLDALAAIDILAATPVCSPAAKGAAASMLAGSFAPMFPVDLVAKDFGATLATADAIHAAMPIATAKRAVFVEAIRRGPGPDNITGTARLNG